MSPAVARAKSSYCTRSYDRKQKDENIYVCDTSKTSKRVDEQTERRADRASKLGLIARWSYEFGFISIHDPTTGEWHDLPTKDAPAWAKREVFKRKELKKHRGIHRTLTASEMEEVWEEEQAPMWEQPAVTDKGIVYEDYLDAE